MRRLLIAALAAGILSVAAVAIATAHVNHRTDEWPMTCVELNDIVETHLGNLENVHIYQRTFGNRAEQACRNDHGDDVRSTFSWAISAGGTAATDGTSSPTVEDASMQWPITCVELNDIVEGHFGNQGNVAIYQNTFGDQAEAACRNDHREDVRSTFRWAVLGGLPWVADGVVWTEELVLDIWHGIADHNWDLAALIAGWAWFADALDSDDYYSREQETLRGLAEVAERFPALAEPVSGYSWLADDLTESEVFSVWILIQLAERDVEIAVWAAGLPWVADGVHYHESFALSGLEHLARTVPQLLRQVSHLVESAPVADRNKYLLHALSYLYRWDEHLEIDKLQQLTSQPWFNDGLNAEEVAFVTAYNAAPDEPRVYNDLLRSRITQSKTISLPLTGEVNLWAFQAEPFPAGENFVGMMEEVVRGAESLMGAPFPTTDVIVLVVDDSKYLLGFAGSFGDFHVRIARPQKFVHRELVYHEIAHYFLSDRIGPHWLVEGGANFAVAYTLDLIGHRSLGESKRVYSEAVKDQCTSHGITNIHQMHIHQMKSGDALQQGYRCGYQIGAHFLISLYEALGKEPVSAALRELYFRSIDNTYDDRADEELVYQVFLKHTPAGLEGRFRDLYRRLHGGPYADAGS